jgi:Protein of unknown function (DUF4242)
MSLSRILGGMVFVVESVGRFTRDMDGGRDIERYLPGLCHSDLLRCLSKLERALERSGVTPTVRYLGSTIVLGDEACFCQFDGPSEAAVAEANLKAGLTFDRIVPAVTVRPTRGEAR